MTAVSNVKIVFVNNSSLIPSMSVETQYPGGAEVTVFGTNVPTTQPGQTQFLAEWEAGLGNQNTTNMSVNIGGALFTYKFKAQNSMVVTITYSSDGIITFES